jgi:hypothetical protein
MVSLLIVTGHCMRASYLQLFEITTQINEKLKFKQMVLKRLFAPDGHGDSQQQK